MFTDHINLNRSDNRRKNIRICTKRQNSRNRNKRNKYGYKGLIWREENKKWEVTICINGKPKYLGRHSDIKNAALAYDKAAIEYFGEFAHLNFPNIMGD